MPGARGVGVLLYKNFLWVLGIARGVLGWVVVITGTCGRCDPR